MDPVISEPEKSNTRAVFEVNGGYNIWLSLRHPGLGTIQLSDGLAQHAVGNILGLPVADATPEPLTSPYHVTHVIGRTEIPYIGILKGERQLGI